MQYRFCRRATSVGFGKPVCLWSDPLAHRGSPCHSRKIQDKLAGLVRNFGDELIRNEIRTVHGTSSKPYHDDDPGEGDAPHVLSCWMMRSSKALDSEEAESPRLRRHLISCCGVVVSEIVVRNCFGSHQCQLLEWADHVQLYLYITRPTGVPVVSRLNF